MSYQTQLISPTSNHKRTSQGLHRLSGSSRWWKPVLKLNILFTVTTHTYIDVTTSLKTQKSNSDPYKLSKTTTPNTMTLSTTKTRTGMMIYTINTSYNFGMMTTRQWTMRTTPTLWTIYCPGHLSNRGNQILMPSNISRMQKRHRPHLASSMSLHACPCN